MLIEVARDKEAGINSNIHIEVLRDGDEDELNHDCPDVVDVVRPVDFRKSRVIACLPKLLPNFFTLHREKSIQ